MDYSATDDSGQLHGVTLSFTDPVGRGVQIRADNNAGLSTSGTINYVVPTSAPDGAYKLFEVIVYDRAQNFSYYNPDGSVRRSPQGVSGPSSHSFNLSGTSFTVSGGAAASQSPSGTAPASAATASPTAPSASPDTSPPTSSAPDPQPTATPVHWATPAPSPSPSASASSSGSSPSPSLAPTTTQGNDIPTTNISPALVRFGGSTVNVIITGTPGAVVDLYTRKFPQKIFVKIRSGLVLDSQGQVVAATKPDVNLRFQALDRTVAAGSNVGGTAGLVTVEKQVSLNVSRLGTRAFKFTGSISPLNQGAVVNLYRNGRLIRQGIAVNSVRVYSYTATLPAGTSTFQVRSPATGYNNLSLSRSVLVRVY